MSSSVLCLKLHSDSETIRVRVDPESCQSYDQLCSYVEKAWRELQFRDYRLFYMDDSDELCLLNDLSLSDALALADAQGKATKSVPVIDIYVDAYSEEAPSFTPLDSEALAVADLLDGLDYVIDPLSALRLVDCLAAADQDMGKVADSLKTKKATKEVHKNAADSKNVTKSSEGVVDSKATNKAPEKVADAKATSNIPEKTASEKSVTVEGKGGDKQVVEEKPQVTVNCEKMVQRSGDEPEVVRMQKEVSSEKEAKDAMVDFLSKSGFVTGKKAGKELVNSMFQDMSSIREVADRLMGYEEADDKKDAKQVEDEAKELQGVTTDPLARSFVDMLSDYGLIQNKAAARELVSALMATQADLDGLSKR
ncbi:hypothetical protein Pmar_PMAR009035, partial [Perkinsus marinus ATCC 50983]